MSKEMMKAGIIDEIMEDAMDSALDSEDMEDEADAEVDKVQLAQWFPLLRQHRGTWPMPGQAAACPSPAEGFQSAMPLITPRPACTHMVVAAHHAK